MASGHWDHVVESFGLQMYILQTSCTVFIQYIYIYIYYIYIWIYVCWYRYLNFVSYCCSLPSPMALPIRYSVIMFLYISSYSYFVIFFESFSFLFNAVRGGWWWFSDWLRGQACSLASCIFCLCFYFALFVSYMSISHAFVCFVFSPPPCLLYSFMFTLIFIFLLFIFSSCCFRFLFDVGWCIRVYLFLNLCDFFFNHAPFCTVCLPRRLLFTIIFLAIFPS